MCVCVSCGELSSCLAFSDGNKVVCLARYRGADKSLARPGRKRATATKLFCKSLQKNSECCPTNQVSAAALTSASDEKWRPFNCFFSRVGLRTYQHPCISSPVPTILLVLVYVKPYRNCIQGVTGGTDQTSGECSLGQTIPI